MTRSLWIRLRPFAFALGAAVVLGLPFFFVWRATFGAGTDIQRLRHPATSADLPRIWFDARVVQIPAPACVVREEVYRDKQWRLERPLQPVDVPIVNGGRHYLVAVAALESDEERRADDAVVRDAGAPPASDGVRYRSVCVESDDRVWIDGCLAQDGVTIDACSAREPLGGIGAPGGLEGERLARRNKRASAIWFAAIVAFLAFVLGVRSLRAAGHRLMPLVRESVTGGWAYAGALPIIVLVVVATFLEAPPFTLLFPFVLAFPFGFVLIRAARFRDVAAQLEAPLDGMMVLEGRVGEESPLGPSVLEGRPVAASIVSVARVVRGKNVEFIPVGEVQDRGRLEVNVGEETVKLEIDDAVFELAQDVEKEMVGRDLPRDVREELELQADTAYRLREACLLRGDPITLLVEARKVEAPAGEGASAYRAASLKGYLQIGERSAVFEGTREEAIARLLGKARALELRASVFGGLAYVGLAWAFALAWLTR